MKTSLCIQALEAVHNGDWDQAHRIIQDIDTSEAAWVHAHLHRIEGDLANAAYWYRRARKPECTESLEKEFNTLFDALT